MSPSVVVVFDIDDTLYLERDYVRSGFDAVGSYVRHELGVEGFADECWGLFLAGVRHRIFDVALERRGLKPAAHIAGLVECYRSHEPDIQLLPDARDCLDALWGEVGLAALTDGPSASQRAKVRALVLERWLRPIIVTADLGPRAGKPSPTGFLEIEGAYGPDREFVYVADNPAKDFAAPAAMGWHTVRVRRSGGLHAGTESAPDVHAEIDDLSAFPALFPTRVKERG